MATRTGLAMGLLLASFIAAAQEPSSAGDRPAAARPPLRPGDEDLISWIGDACPSFPNLATVAHLDQVAGKAVGDWLRTGRYREAHALAVRYLDCLRRAALARPDAAFDVFAADALIAARVSMLEQVLCFLPLVIFEIEQRVDGDLASQSLDRCPRPAQKPSGDRGVWGEAVRRYLHLMAAVRPPSEVLEAALTFLEGFREAGFQLPDRASRLPTTVEQGPKEAPVTQEGQQTSEKDDDAPDPVFAVIVLGVGAAVASGDLDGLVRVVRAGTTTGQDESGASSGGGVTHEYAEPAQRPATQWDDVCSSPFLAAMGVIQALTWSPAGPRRAALPILQTALVARAPLDIRIRTVRAAIERFEAALPDAVEAPGRRRICMITQVVASLVFASLDSETFDRAVAEGRVGDLALLVSTTPLIVGLPGSPEARFQVLRVVADQASGDEERARWLCALGDTAIAANRISDAAEAFGFAASLPVEAGKTCGLRGLLGALIADPTADPDRLAKAARAFVSNAPDAPDVYAIISNAPDQRAKAVAIRALSGAGRAGPTGRGLVEPVMEALIKVVDTDPGSESARLAVEAIKQAGGPSSPQDRVIWGLVSGRHYVMSRKEREAILVLKEAFSRAGPEIEGVQEGTAALLRWLAASDHVRVLDRTVKLARSARVVEPSVLAQVGAIRGERGDRRRAKALLRMAVLGRPSEPEAWLTIADAYARVDEPTLASAALEQAGSEASWDGRHYMVRGRIEMARKRYREAAAAYTRASDLSRGECEPLFFRGLVRLLVGDGEGAGQDFERCIEMGQASPSVLGGLAYAHFDQSEWEKAEQAFRMALAKDEKTADNHLGLALTLFRLGRIEEARRAYKRAVELEPAIGLGYNEAEKKGYVYTAIEKKAWTEMLRAFRGMRGQKR